MRICIISDNKNAYATQQFKKEASLSGNNVFIISREKISFNGISLLLDKKRDLKTFDTVILRAPVSSLTPLSLILDYCIAKNVRLLNRNFYLQYQSVHKLRQQSLFCNKKIPCLKTVYGEKESYSSLKKKLGIPFVAKLANGSLGKQVFKINSAKEFKYFIDARTKDGQIYLFQKFYSIPCDYRVFIIGNEVFGPVKRIAPQGEWRTNSHGATHERADEKKNVLKLAKTLIQKTGIEFAGVDILIDSSGKPRIIEINTMADFKVFDNVYPEINIAQKTIDMLQRTMMNSRI